MIMQIPFQGFYESQHSHELDREIESMFSDESGCDFNPDFVDRAYGVADFGKARLYIAQKYAEYFSHKTGIKCEFESLQSPREYNFETDRIFVTIELSELQRMRGEVSDPTFAGVLRELFTPCSGFIPHYSDCLDQWPDLPEYDHNEAYALLLAYLYEMGLDDIESDFIESFCGNGGYGEALANDAMNALWTEFSELEPA